MLFCENISIGQKLYTAQSWKLKQAYTKNEIVYILLSTMEDLAKSYAKGILRKV